ncbi:hypothetical protein OHB14_45105 [Streptomyces sp. NBC_01613]|uniref:hypothetical protein n=1 Tax=Streptomyces sp. NBC_01613 TaxID=2975896 RepID=UPI0038684143
MTIAADGTFTMARRTYLDCGQNPQPCDSVINNEIIDGAIAHGTLKSVSGTVAKGNITKSTDSSRLPKGPVTFTLDTANDLIKALNLNWCASSAPSGICY